MKKLLCMSLLATTFAVVGCRLSTEDFHSANAYTGTIPVKFKPEVKMIGEKTVHGEARSLRIFWFIPVQWPNSFAKDLEGSRYLFGNSMERAAMYDACQKADADILIAPRATTKVKYGFLWFYKKVTSEVEGYPAEITGANEVPFEQWAPYIGVKCCQ